MDSNDTALLAVIAKKLRELRADFVGLSKQPGPAGRDGKDGDDGVGTAGRDGLDGKVGERGPVGPRGPVDPPGKDGIDGAAGERGPVGKWTDLQGKPGKASTGGGVFVGGGSSGGTPWNPDSLPVASNATPAEFIVKQGTTWRRATYAQMQTWLGGTPMPGPTTGVLTEGGDYLTTENGDFIVQE